MNIEIKPIQKNYKVLLDTYPPKTANKFLPDWYKKMKLGSLDITKGSGNLNAKNCPAIQDYVSEGFVIPIWANLTFQTHKDQEGNIEGHTWDFTARNATGEPIESHVGTHMKEQTGEMDLQIMSSGTILKLQLPYYFKTPEGYSTLFMDPFYHFRKDIRCLSAIVDTDVWGSVAFVFEILKDNFYIQGGTPLVLAHVFKRDNFNLEIKDGDEEFYEEVLNKRQKIHLGVNQTYKELFS